MFVFKQKPGLVILLACAFLASQPAISMAAGDEDLAAMRLQLEALSKRLDKLEADNKALAASNAQLRNVGPAEHAGDTAIASSAAGSDASVASTTDSPVVAATSTGKSSDKESNWSDRIRWEGDFRYRYENIDIQNRDSRNRSRIRARAHLIADITPDVTVGFGFASGGDDPVSSNQTLGRAGSSKGLALDLAYFKWSAIEDTNIYGGKFKNYLYKSGGNQLLWDGDWRPEGTAVIWDNDTFFANGLGTWIESDSDNQESFAYVLQAGINFPIGDDVNVTAGVGYNVFDVQGLGSIYGDIDDFYGNSFDPVTQTYLYDYEVFEAFADVTIDVFDRPLQFYGDYVQNQATDRNNSGYIFGLNYGKASNKGQWSVSYAYEKLEADAVFGLLSNSDFGRGGTDAKGSIFNANYAIHKGVNAVVTYYVTDVGIRTGNPIDVNRLQMDLSFKYK